MSGIRSDPSRSKKKSQSGEFDLKGFPGLSIAKATQLTARQGQSDHALESPAFLLTHLRL